jgi:hypothetical protein
MSSAHQLRHRKKTKGGVLTGVPSEIIKAIARHGSQRRTGAGKIERDQRNLMYEFSEEDLRISAEVYTRFDEFITAPEKTDIWCPRCQSFVEQGRMPTTATKVAARCNCRIERVLVDKYEKLNHDDWDRIINAI